MGSGKGGAGEVGKGDPAGVGRGFSSPCEGGRAGAGMNLLVDALGADTTGFLEDGRGLRRWGDLRKFGEAGEAAG